MEDLESRILEKETEIIEYRENKKNSIRACVLDSVLLIASGYVGYANLIHNITAPSLDVKDLLGAVGCAFGLYFAYLGAKNLNRVIKNKRILREAEEELKELKPRKY